MTRGLITDPVDKGCINELTRMVIGNAIYFKADWRQKFIKTNTSKRPFYKFYGFTNMVDTMYQQDSFGYYEDQDV